MALLLLLFLLLSFVFLNILIEKLVEPITLVLWVTADINFLSHMRNVSNFVVHLTLLLMHLRDLKIRN